MSRTASALLYVILSPSYSPVASPRESGSDSHSVAAARRRPTAECACVDTTSVGTPALTVRHSTQSSQTTKEMRFLAISEELGLRRFSRAAQARTHRRRGQTLENAEHNGGGTCGFFCLLCGSSAHSLLLCGSIHRDSCRGWLVTAVAYAVLRRELSFTSRFSSFPCLLLPFVLCAHSTACGITHASSAGRASELVPGRASLC